AEEVRLSAIPELYALYEEERERDLKGQPSLRGLLEREVVDSGTSVYTTPPKAEALVKALATPDARPAVRQVAAKSLPEMYHSLAGKELAEKLTWASKDLRPRIRASLEQALLDTPPEVQATVADSLDVCDALDRVDPDDEVKRTVYFRLNAAQLPSQQYTLEVVQRAIADQFPALRARLTKLAT